MIYTCQTIKSPPLTPISVLSWARKIHRTWSDGYEAKDAEAYKEVKDVYAAVGST